MSDDRGKIHNENRAKQIIDFSGLRWGNITPTDMDGLLDFFDQAWVVYETKLELTPLPFGQRLAFKRLVDDLSKTGKPCILIISTHREHDTSRPIRAAETMVTQYRYKGEWYNPSHPMTTLELINKFLDRNHIEVKDSDIPF